MKNIFVFQTLKQLLELPVSFSFPFTFAKSPLKTRCMILSEQEGAEIWIGGQRTKFTTPHLLELPLGQEVSVEIRHPGYESKKAWIRSAELQSFYYCDLPRIPLRLVSDEEDEEIPAKNKSQLKSKINRDFKSEDQQKFPLEATHAQNQAPDHSTP